MKIGGRSIWLTTLIVGFLAALSWPQTSTTSLRGTIVDPNGAVIPGADVVLAKLLDRIFSSDQNRWSGLLSISCSPTDYLHAHRSGARVRRPTIG